ncbi:MAG: cytochrome c peroxidase [Hyphomicrobium sp.]|jgi:cytochrome c peroxidase
MLSPRFSGKLQAGKRTALRLTVAALGVALLHAMSADYGRAQIVDAVVEPPSLKGILPLLADTSDYIADMDAARQLGKALFWDTQVGSDGTACASCHFHAGADIRTKNQVDPGSRSDDTIFEPKATGGLSGPNKQLADADFPLHKLADPANRESKVTFDTNDVVSSMGTFAGDFVSSRRRTSQGARGSAVAGIIARFGFDTGRRGALTSSDACRLTYEPSDDATGTGSPFHADGLIYRKVEPRQTPTTINAVFNFRQFWDGRANNEFNGVDPFGPRTYTPAFTANGVIYGNPFAAGTGILVADLSAHAAGKSIVVLSQPLIRNSSLASQAVGPPLSDFEMSCSGKTFADMGRKLLPMRALSTQVVDVNDSLFGKTPGLVNTLPLPGINTTYEGLVKTAFKAKYWAAPGRFVIDPKTGIVATSQIAGLTQIEHNFSLFWGLAIQAYESVLVSDDAPYDRGDAALSASALKGKTVFMGKGKCIACHNGPLFSGGTVTSPAASSPEVVEGMVMGDGKPAIYDHGFYNIGVRATEEDRGAGAIDPYNFDLSFTREYKWRLLARKDLSPDHFDVGPCRYSSSLCLAPPGPLTDPSALPRDAVDGAFKVPILRNVGLNPPYFHNGGQATLKDVVRFYNRGGDRRGALNDDTTGLALATPFGVVNKTNLNPDVGDASNTSRNNALGLTEVEMDDLVEFLLSLTDQRVACHSGVFDHPALPLVIGHQDVAKGGTRRARDMVATLPAVGQRGLSTCFPNTGDLFGKLQATFRQIVKQNE